MAHFTFICGVVVQLEHHNAGTVTVRERGNQRLYHSPDNGLAADSRTVQPDA